MCRNPSSSIAAASLPLAGEASLPRTTNGAVQRGCLFSRVEFFCQCSKQKFSQVLKTLPADDREEILENGPFPMETKCHHCGSAYWFEKNELQSLWV